MANEIEFRITGKYEAGPAFRKAKDDAEGLGKTTKETTEKTRGLGDEVDKTSKKVKGFGDNSRKSSADLRALDADIVRVKQSIKDLGSEFTRASAEDRLSINKKLKVERSTLSDLQRVRKEITGLAEDGGRAATTFASLFQGGLINALKTPLGATLAGVIGVPAVIGAGATIGGAATAGVGAGVAGAGVAGAALQSQKVRDEWSKTTSVIKKDFLDATTSFEGPTLSAIKRIGGAIHTDVNLKAIFGNAEKFVEPLADSTAKAIVSIGHGFESLTSKAMPAVVALANGVEQLGDATGIALERIGNGSEGGAKALDDTLTAIADLIIVTGTWIGWFEDAYGAVVRLTDGLREIHPVFGFVADSIDEITGNKKISQLSGELDYSAAAARGAYDDFENLSAGMYNTADAAKTLDDSFKSLLDIELNLGEANLKAMQGWADLKDELKDGKKTLDERTQAGRDNVKAIFDQLEVLKQVRDAEIAAGDGTVESARAANQAYESQVEGIRQILIHLGFAKAEVDNFLAAFLAINGKSVDISVNTHFNDFYARQGANNSAFDAGDRLARRGIDRAMGGIPGAASGMVTSGLAGRMTQVAERGREIALLAPGVANLPPGSQILPNGQTEGLLGGAGAGGGPTINVALVSSGGGDEVADMINELIRKRALKLVVINGRVSPE